MKKGIIMPNWVSIIPFLVVIPIAMWTKQVLSGLIVGLLIGGYLAEPSLLGGLQKSVYYIIHSMTASSKLKIIVFLYLFSGLIGMIKLSGGIKGFVDMASKKIKSKTGALMLIWISVIGTFSAPTLRIVTVTPVMKALAEKINIPKKKIGFAIQTTSSPIIVLIPIATAFVGYMVSLVHLSLKNQGIKGNAYSLYLHSIPFNFSSFALILIGVYYVLFHRPEVSRENVQEDAANTGGVLDPNGNIQPQSTGQPQLGSQRPLPQQFEMNTPNHQWNNPAIRMNNEFSRELTPENSVDQNLKQNEDQMNQGNPQLPPDNGQEINRGARDNNIVSPNLHTQNHTGAGVDTAGLSSMRQTSSISRDNHWEDSHPSVAKELPSRPWNLLVPLIVVIVMTLFVTWWNGQSKANSFAQAFMKADVMGSMIIALIITLFLLLTMMLIQKIPLKETIAHFVSGGNDLMKVILLLSVVWALTAVTQDLGFAKFVTSSTQWIPTFLVPPIMFVLGSLIAYFIGSSWGTWGMLMPLGIAMAQTSHTSLALIIGTVFASGTFGAFASPLGGTTVATAQILGMEVMDYSFYKLKPALVAAGAATIAYGAATFLF